ncbi:MAG: FAD-binding oxidoreductase [Chlorobi bacterium]|nr:FAD-binding oxidoreductase [Chlorobiota bacterium]
MMNIRSWSGLPFPESSRWIALHWTSETPFTWSNDVLLPRGCGRSYGDVCLPSQTAVLCTPCDRIRRFDRERGIICLEAGARISDILRLTIPAGWTLPVVPGTAQVTIGGAIANDIHGKSHHWAGTFGRWVERLELLRSDQRIVCTPCDNAELFRATIGGLGLTGIITWAELQLVPTRSPWLETRNIAFSTLDEFFAITAEIEQNTEYVVGWCDLSVAGRIRGIVHASSFCDENAQSRTPRPSSANLPTLPVSVWTQATVRVANTLRWQMLSRRPIVREHYSQAFFPLDHVPWNRLFGRRGFYQLHAVIPRQIERTGIDRIVARLWEAKLPVPLCVLKRFADIASPGMLSFPIAGTSIAVDVPNTAHASAALKAIITDVVEMGGRVYPAKDALMTALHFQRMYPHWQRLEKLRDRRTCSQFWERVTHVTSP